MLKELLARQHQGYRTIPFPKEAPVLPERLVARPEIDQSKCIQGCVICTDVCPVDAVTLKSGSLSLDLGRCLFCAECEHACPQGAIRFTNEYRMAVRNRNNLILDGESIKLATRLEGKIGKVLGRALKLREVSAGGCNACEADVNVLNTVGFDLGRFGIQFVASPRHADGVLITGPVSENMRLGLMKTWEAVPEPRIAIAVGACAIAGGPYLDHAEINNGATSLIPIDLFIPGCPPHPITILDGLLRLIGKIEDGSVSCGKTTASLNRD